MVYPPIVTPEPYVADYDAVTGRNDEVTNIKRKVASEHIYWDQASVLVQVGLTDPESLPVSDAESARKILGPASVASNRLIERADRSKRARSDG